MTVISGTSGYFVAGAAGAGATVGEINRYTISKSANPIDVSVFGDRWQDYVNGSVGWTASISGFYDCSDTAQDAIEDGLDAGTAVEIYAHINNTKYYYGLTYPTNVTVEDTHDGVVTVTMDLQGTGQLYRTCV